MAERVFDGTRINNPMEDASQIRGKGLGEKTPSLKMFIIATEARNSGESSQNCHQNRSTAEEIHTDSAIGSGNIGREGHNIAALSTFHGGIAGSGDSTGIPSKNFENFQYLEEIRGLSQTQTQHREGKQPVQDLGQSSTPLMDEQFIKKQGMDTSIIHNNSRLNVLPANQTQLNSDSEHLRNENDQQQTWVPKEQGKNITINSNIRANQQQVYQDNFPRISRNFDKQAPKTNTNHVRRDRPPVNPPNLPKTDPLTAPAPYTVVQTYADRLRYNQAKCDVSIILTAPEITTKQGLHAVLYVKEEVMRDLAATCKFILIGKFSYTMPKLELIRKNFILQTQLSGGVKIAHFNSRHVYIDLDNELDYNMVWTKQRMSIAGQVMRIQVWTPNFKPAEETPIVPIWISLPELPWHCYNKEFVTGLLSPIGKVLYLDSASIKKTRGSQARVNVQVDLTQKRPSYIWMGYIGEDITDGRWQKLEYDNIPNYCFYCKHQGHLESDCTIRQRDEDKKKKDMEAVRNKNYKEMDKNTQSKSQKEGDQKEGTNQQYNKQRDQEQKQYQQEDQWQTQKRRNNNQLQAPRGNPRQAEQTTNQAGITNIPTQNTYINLDVQESSHSLEVLDNYKGTKGDSRPHIAATNQKGQDEYNRKIANAGKDTTKKLQVDIISK
ncbi:hypothetical protein KY290_001070 [Solanum tuberosum]|uniref:CCHC-type domain-containing protein n=1 Tax=Solanum tuberosum TaxID=4113 RepID=A0ABQ7WNB7_SOLTU|nr:hypothetical protein KY290_001070 [Solanum tuberosum]